MPDITLNQYSNWARANLDTTVSLAKTDSGAQLSDIKATTTGAQRFFHSSAFKGQTKEVRADFQRALTVRFGSTLAQEALNSIGGKPLTGAKIQEAIKYAQSHDTSVRNTVALPGSLTAPDAKPTARLTDAELPKEDLPKLVGNKTPELRKLQDCTALLKKAAADVLGTFPTGDGEIAQMEAQCDYLKAEFALLSEKFAHLESDGNTEVKGFSQACSDACKALEDHLASMKTANAEGPLKDASVGRFKGVWHAAFKEACAKLSENPKVANNPQAKAALQDMAKISEDDFSAMFKLDKDLGKNLGKEMATTLQKACGKKLIDAKACQKALMEANKEVLNQRAWNPIRKEFQGALNGENFKITSEITPGKHVKGVGETYPEGVGGFMCHCATEKDHAVNMAVSKVTVEGKDGKETEAFTGVRHGVHSAWEIKNSAERKAANLNRAKETVKAAFIAYLAKNPGLSNTGRIHLPMASVSLLTPDVLRDFAAMFTKKQTNNETRMLIEQAEAWETINEGGAMDITMEVDGQQKTFSVKPEIMTFSFGVNGLSFGAVNAVAQSWAISDLFNKDSAQMLETWTNRFTQDTSIPKEKREAAQTLMTQIKEILAAKAERTDAHDGYKAAARVAVLTSLMNGMPCWNCKSGKDRTGELDVECKFLATLIARGEEIPKPGAKLTEGQQRLFRSIALQSGNLEMQEYNTGISGFKTEKVDSIVERLGGAEGRKFHAGGSKFVKF